MHPYRNTPVTRLWECGDVIIDLDKITVCCLDGEPKTLYVYLVGDPDGLELTLSEGSALLEAWRDYRRA
jgi:hypothetical protein